MKPTANEIMGMLEEAETLGLITINDSSKLEDWLHDDQGYLYLEELRGDQS